MTGSASTGVFISLNKLGIRKERPYDKAKQSNQLANIHRPNNLDGGENYWFNGCAAYVMECLGEPDFDYCFFSGLTGDVLAQMYAYGKFRGDGVTDYSIGNFSEDNCSDRHIKSVFAACGYESTIVFKKDLLANREKHLQTLMAYIDKGVPVIQFGYGCDGPPWGVFVGYEDGGQTLLFATGKKDEPWRVPLDKALTNWIFVGEKKEQKELRQLYRDVIANLPKLLTIKTEEYCFGAEAFRAWAADIENGKFDGVKPEDFDRWGMHEVYVCALATNSGGSQRFLRKALELNPDLAFLRDVCRQYRITGLLWSQKDSSWYLYDCPKCHGQPCRSEQGCQNCKQLTADQAEDKERYGKVKDLEKLGGGFNIKLKTLQRPSRKRAQIVAVIRQCANCVDEVVKILNENMQ